jgi:hypothetical protein
MPVLSKSRCGIVKLGAGRRLEAIPFSERAPGVLAGPFSAVALCARHLPSTLPKPHAMSSARCTSIHRVSSRLHNTGPIRFLCANEM